MNGMKKLLLISLLSGCATEPWIYGVVQEVRINRARTQWGVKVVKTQVEIDGAVIVILTSRGGRLAAITACNLPRISLLRPGDAVRAMRQPYECSGWLIETVSP